MTRSRSGPVTKWLTVTAEKFARPNPWTDVFLGAAGVVVTMGCGDACPIVPGKKYADWDVEDPTGKGLDEIRLIRAEVKRRVELLLDELLSHAMS